MTIDNVLGVATAARGNVLLLIFGLVVGPAKWLEERRGRLHS